MTFASFTNLVVAALCVAVLLQSVRMMRSIRAMKSGDLGDTIASLDRATAQARGVLADLKDVLTTDGAANIRTIASGETLRDELSVMVGIGNAVADRIMDAATAAGERRETAERPTPPLPKRPRRRRGPAKPDGALPTAPAPVQARLQ
jgi:hypothetical protein